MQLGYCEVQPSPPKAASTEHLKSPRSDLNLLTSLALGNIIKFLLKEVA